MHKKVMYTKGKGVAGAPGAACDPELVGATSGYGEKSVCSTGMVDDNGDDKRPAFQGYMNGAWWNVDILQKTGDFFWARFVNFPGTPSSRVPLSELRLRPRPCDDWDCQRALVKGHDVTLETIHPAAEMTDTPIRALYDANIVSKRTFPHDPDCRCVFTLQLYTSAQGYIPESPSERSLGKYIPLDVDITKLYILQRPNAPLQEVLKAHISSSTNEISDWTSDAQSLRNVYLHKVADEENESSTTCPDDNLSDDKDFGMSMSGSATQSRDQRKVARMSRHETIRMASRSTSRSSGVEKLDRGAAAATLHGRGTRSPPDLVGKRLPPQHSLKRKWNSTTEKRSIDFQEAEIGLKAKLAGKELDGDLRKSADSTVHAGGRNISGSFRKGDSGGKLKGKVDDSTSSGESPSSDSDQRNPGDFGHKMMRRRTALGSSKPEPEGRMASKDPLRFPKQRVPPSAATPIFQGKLRHSSKPPRGPCDDSSGRPILDRDRFQQRRTPACEQETIFIPDADSDDPQDLQLGRKRVRQDSSESSEESEYKGIRIPKSSKGGGGRFSQHSHLDIGKEGRRSYAKLEAELVDLVDDPGVVSKKGRSTRSKQGEDGKSWSHGIAAANKQAMLKQKSLSPILSSPHKKKLQGKEQLKPRTDKLSPTEEAHKVQTLDSDSEGEFDYDQCRRGGNLKPKASASLKARVTSEKRQIKIPNRLKKVTSEKDSPEKVPVVTRPLYEDLLDSNPLNTDAETTDPAAAQKQATKECTWTLCSDHGSDSDISDDAAQKVKEEGTTPEDHSSILTESLSKKQDELVQTVQPQQRSARNEVDAVELRRVQSEAEAVELRSVQSEAEAVGLKSAQSEAEAVGLKSAQSEAEAVGLRGVQSEAEAVGLKSAQSEAKAAGLKNVQREAEAVEPKPVPHVAEASEFKRLQREAASVQSERVPTEAESAELNRVQKEAESVDVGRAIFGKSAGEGREEFVGTVCNVAGDVSEQVDREVGAQTAAEVAGGVAEQNAKEVSRGVAQNAEDVTREVAAQAAEETAEEVAVQNAEEVSAQDAKEVSVQDAGEVSVQGVEQVVTEEVAEHAAEEVTVKAAKSVVTTQRPEDIISKSDEDVAGEVPRQGTSDGAKDVTLGTPAENAGGTAENIALCTAETITGGVAGDTVRNDAEIITSSNAQDSIGGAAQSGTGGTVKETAGGLAEDITRDSAGGVAGDGAGGAAGGSGRDIARDATEDVAQDLDESASRDAARESPGIAVTETLSDESDDEWDNLAEMTCSHEETILKDDVGEVCIRCGLVSVLIEHIIPQIEIFKPRTRESDADDWDFGDGSPVADHGNNADSGLDGGKEGVTMLSISLPPHYEKKMHPHQKEGYEFLWRNLTEGEGECRRRVMDKVAGCVLSHAPGTGKSFLVVAFLMSFTSKFPGCRPLIVAPKIMLRRWEKEFSQWKSNMEVFILNTAHEHSKKLILKHGEQGLIDNSRPMTARQTVEFGRQAVLREWKAKQRSVLLVSYNLFSTLSDDEGLKKNREGEVTGKALLQLPGIVILDEGHFPRNQNTKVRRALMKVQARSRILLSGTLFQNNFEELFNTLYLVRPGFVEAFSGCDLSDISITGIKETLPGEGALKMMDKITEAAEKKARKLFVEEIGRKIEQGQCSNGSEALQHGLQMLQRLTSEFVHHHPGEVLACLPGLRDFGILLEPTVLQRSLLRLVEERLQKPDEYLKKEVAVSEASIHPILLTKLEYIKTDVFSCTEEPRDPIVRQWDWEGMVRAPNPEDGVKTKFVFDLLHALKSTKEKVLIFSQHMPPLDLLQGMLKRVFNWDMNRDVLRLDGTMSMDERETTIEKFNAEKSEVQVLLASTKACGEGINLIGASRVVFLDVLWNPAVIKQAISRAFRLGQRNVVYVYRLISIDTSEESKYKKAIRKDWLSMTIFGSSSGDVEPLDVGERVIDAGKSVGELRAWEVNSDTCEDSVLETLLRSDKSHSNAFKKVVEHGSQFHFRKAPCGPDARDFFVAGSAYGDLENIRETGIAEFGTGRVNPQKIAAKLYQDFGGFGEFDPKGLTVISEGLTVISDTDDDM